MAIIRRIYLHGKCSWYAILHFVLHIHTLRLFHIYMVTHLYCLTLFQGASEMYVGRGGGRGAEVNLPPVIIFRNIIPNLIKLGNRTSDEEKNIYKLFGLSDGFITFLLRSSKSAFSKDYVKMAISSLVFVMTGWLTPQMKAYEFLYQGK